MAAFFKNDHICRYFRENLKSDVDYRFLAFNSRKSNEIKAN